MKEYTLVIKFAAQNCDHARQIAVWATDEHSVFNSDGVQFQSVEILTRVSAS